MPRTSLPSWAILPLREPLTAAQLCARAKGSGAEPTAEGMIQLPGGFLGWIDPRPLPDHLIDDSISEDPPSGGAAMLHLSGGNNAFEVEVHTQPPEVRRIKAKLDARRRPDDERIISVAGLKVERLTSLLEALLPHAEGLILPCANDMAFSSEEFLAHVEDLGPGRYHFPLYAFTKVRADADGPYVSTTGMFIFGLPDVAMPYDDELGQKDVANAVGEIQREMVAEGWWPRDGEHFDTRVGPVDFTRTLGGIFATPLEVELYEDAVEVAKYRFARERWWAGAGAPAVVYRVREEDLIMDHHLVLDGPSCAITNGLALTKQEGSTPEDENERVEVALIGNAVGTWATGWLAWIVACIRGHGGSNPIRPFDRMALSEPEAGVAGCILWPRGEPVDAGLDAPVNIWSMVPILVEELAAFRAQPGAQEAWMKERLAKGDVEGLSERWARVVPRR